MTRQPARFFLVKGPTEVMRKHGSIKPITDDHPFIKLKKTLESEALNYELQEPTQDNPDVHDRLIITLPIEFMDSEEFKFLEDWMREIDQNVPVHSLRSLSGEAVFVLPDIGLPNNLKSEQFKLRGRLMLDFYPCSLPIVLGGGGDVVDPPQVAFACKLWKSSSIEKVAMELIAEADNPTPPPKTNKMAEKLRDVFNKTGTRPQEPRMVTEYRLHVVAKQVLLTLKIFWYANYGLSAWDPSPEGEWVEKETDGPCFGDSDNYYGLIREVLGLDIKGNDFHCLLWENWMNFMADLDLISVEIRWWWPFQLFFTQQDLNDLQEIIDKELEF